MHFLFVFCLCAALMCHCAHTRESEGNNLLGNVLNHSSIQNTCISISSGLLDDAIVSDLIDDRSNTLQDKECIYFLDRDALSNELLSTKMKVMNVSELGSISFAVLASDFSVFVVDEETTAVTEFWFPRQVINWEKKLWESSEECTVHDWWGNKPTHCIFWNEEISESLWPYGSIATESLYLHIYLMSLSDPFLNRRTPRPSPPSPTGPYWRPRDASAMTSLTHFCVRTTSTARWSLGSTTIGVHSWAQTRPLAKWTAGSSQRYSRFWRKCSTLQQSEIIIRLVWTV